MGYSIRLCTLDKTADHLLQLIVKKNAWLVIGFKLPSLVRESIQMFYKMFGKYLLVSFRVLLQYLAKLRAQ